MTKYIIAYENIRIEFTSLESANSYKILHNLDVEVDVVIEKSVTYQKYTHTDIANLALAYQEQEYDNMGITYLQEVKLNLEFYFLAKSTPQAEKMNVLPYCMILAVRKWIERIWAKYDVYKIQILDNVLIENVSFEEVGNPPCSMKDVQWVVDANYQAKQPNRQVNTNITFYQDYLNQK